MKKLVFLCLIVSINSFAQFVKVEGTNFTLEGKPYTYMGTNFWYGANLGSRGPGGDRDRLVRELDNLSKLGIKNLRIMAGTEGPNTEPYRMVPALQTSPGNYDQNILEGLDFLLNEMKKRNMKAVMCLNNFWNWSGGMAQYLVWANEARSIPYPPPHPGGSWSEYQTFTAKFYNSKKAVEMFNNHIRFIVGRVNSISNTPYKDDATIMSWQLANEPRGDREIRAFSVWIEETAKLIKSLDNNHLVTTGSEGDTPYPSAGTDLTNDHSSPYIDYATFHVWVQNWNIYDPRNPASLRDAINFATRYIKVHEDKAVALNKPVVLEEFGISRDGNNHDPSSSIVIRDEYYKAVFSEVFKSVHKKNRALRGVNFWAWAGEGRPTNINGLWMPGNDFIGDPPHEYQGWYSVYDRDGSTLMIIKEFASKINNH